MRRILAPILTIAVLTGFFASSALAYRWPDSSWPNTDFDNRSIDLNEILSGGPPKDGIPPIDQPKFDSVEQAFDWISPLEPVISVSINGEHKAYPMQIMTWHEIVNDKVGDTPVSVTFCPLCNASIVFERILDGELLDFGTTGLLRNSDLVMYDRQSESWWQQFTGMGIVGEHNGKELKRVPSSIISFASFAAAYPEGKVLNRDTGSFRSYGNNPYPGYDNINNSPFLFRGKTSDRLPAMTRVLAVHVNGQDKLYPFDVFDQRKLIADNVGGSDVVIFATGSLLSALDNDTIADSRSVAEVTAWQPQTTDGKVINGFLIKDKNIVDQETQSTWNRLGQAIAGPLKGAQLAAVDSGVHFAFAWLAFNPDTEIFTTSAH